MATVEEILAWQHRVIFGLTERLPCMQGMQRAAFCMLTLKPMLLLALMFWTRRPVLALATRGGPCWVDIRTGQQATLFQLALTATIEFSYLLISLGAGAGVSLVSICGEGRASVSERLTGMHIRYVQLQ